MHTADQILIIIVSSLMSIFFLLLIIVAVILLKLVSSARRLVARAAETMDSVEEVADEAAEAFRQAQGPMAGIKIIRNIIKLSQKKGRNKWGR